MRRWLLVAIAVCAFGGWQHFRGTAVSQPPGVLAPEPPRQRSLDPVPTLSLPGYRISALAGFSLEARVLARRDYSLGRESDLSPTDLALGWGPMSDSTVLEALDIRQANRWYTWRAESLPLPRRTIERSSANMHLIPAHPQVADALEAVRPGMLVRLEGYLVEAQAADGWRWRSSLTRDDVGDGACELVWVERLRLL